MPFHHVFLIERVYLENNIVHLLSKLPLPKGKYIILLSFPENIILS